MIKAKRMALTVLVILAFLSLLWWFAGGREWAGHFLTRLAVQGGDQFVVPNARIPLAITVTQKTDEITVCNQGPVSWTNPTVRINGEYLIHLKGIREGGCATARKTSFISPDWKHLPAPRELPVTEVEVLSQASGLGYTKQEFSPRIAD